MVVHSGRIIRSFQPNGAEDVTGGPIHKLILSHPRIWIGRSQSIRGSVVFSLSQKMVKDVHQLEVVHTDTAARNVIDKVCSVRSYLEVVLIRLCPGCIHGAHKPQ